MKVISEIYVPKETIGDESALVLTLYVKSGDFVEKDDFLVDLESSKAVTTIEAEYDGYVDVYCKEGEEVKINSLLMNIVDKYEKSYIETNILEENIYKYANNTLFSNKALELVKEHNIHKSKFKDHDFVNESDVLSLLTMKKIMTKHTEEIPKVNKSLDLSFDKSLVNMEMVSKSKKLEIKYLSDVQSGVMNSVLNVAVNINNIEATLIKYMKIFKDSYLPLIVYESSRLLKKYKVFNAYFIDDTIAYYKNINIGIATDIDDGLKVLSLPNSDKLAMYEIEDKLYQLFEKYLDKKLDIKDVSGSTFTITDLSPSGIDFFTPLINTKQSAILGISQVDKKLNRLYLTLVFDHRVTEGKIASEFLVGLKKRVESYGLNSKMEEDENTNSDIKCSSCLKTLKEDKEMKGLGMIKIVNHQGKEEYLCHICLAGY